MINIYKYSRAFYVLLFVFIALSGSLSAQQVTEYAKLDSLKVGDTFTYSITLEKDRAYNSVLYPDSSAFGSPFEIRSRQHFKITDFKDSLVYRIQYFGTEDSRIPRLPVRLIADSDTNTVFTRPVPVHFKSVLQSEDEEFRPLKPIFDFAAAIWPYLLALLLLAAIGWYVYKRYKEGLEQDEPEPKPEFEPVPFSNPMETLANTLTQLKSFNFDSKEDFKHFYIQLGDAIRTYFEDLYRIPALESTSREIIYQLERRRVDQRLIDQTKKVLNEADMVKFAKFTPTEKQARAALSAGEDFMSVAREVDSTRLERMRRRHREQVEQKRRKFEARHAGEQEPEHLQPQES